MTPILKKLDLYLLKHFFVSLLVVTVAIGLTIVVINMVEELRDFIDHEVPFLEILKYYVYFAGWVVKSFVPMFVMLAVLFSVSMLARRQEILAMKASGRSLYRMAMPLAIVTILISFGHFYYNEYIFPPANKKRVEMKQFTIEKRSRTSVRKVQNIYRQFSPGCFYTMATFDADRRQGDSFKLYRTRNNELQEIITAERVVYRDYLWRAFTGVRRTFDSGAKKEFVKFDSLDIPDIKENPEDLATRIGKPEDMGLHELKRYIDLMKRTGGPFLRESVDLKLKYSFPIASFIVVLICFPFACNPRKGGVAVSLATGTLVALIYFVLYRVMQSAGYNGKVSEDLAAWGVNGLFFLIGLGFMVSARK
jgi:lipopolysaccharide export system permease protein